MLNYGKHWIDEDDIAAVTETLKSDFLTQGPKVPEFEKALADYTGAKYAVAVSNGTAALHIAVKTLNLDKQSTGITSSITFAASSNCFLYNGMKPAFTDIDPKTYNMDPSSLAAHLSDSTGVVIPVHFAGQPCEMDLITALLGWDPSGDKKYKRFIIEDASHAIGSRYKNGKHVGSCCFSDMTIFSFHPVKTIATGEGGAITTNNEELYERLLLLRNHGITKDPSKLKINDSASITNRWITPGPWYYEMLDLGFNYRLTDIQAALGTSQLKKIDGFIARRREIVHMYNEAFKSIPWLTVPYEREGVFSAFHLYVLKIDYIALGKSRSMVMEELKQRDVGTQVHYIPVYRHPYYCENFGFKYDDFPEAERYYEQCLSIPLYPKMTDDNVNTVIEAITKLK